jgi:signal transduction histidine kinase
MSFAQTTVFDEKAEVVRVRSTTPIKLNSRSSNCDVVSHIGKRRSGATATVSTLAGVPRQPALERLSGPIGTACFRVAQEALTNVVRHAGAQTVSVELHRKPEFLHLIVRDDGIGFDAAVTLDRA